MELLRSDKVAGVITGVFGALLVMFATLGLMMVGMQRLMMETALFPQDDETTSFFEGMKAVHEVWFAYFPLMIAGGVIFAASGMFIWRGSLLARRIAQLNALASYVWVIAYTISCSRIMHLIDAPLDRLPEVGRNIIHWTSLVSSVVMGCAFPTALLCVLRRPRPVQPRMNGIAGPPREQEFTHPA